MNQHSSTYICTCGWAGMFPLITKTEHRDKGILVWKYILLCPDCAKPVKEVK